MATCIYCIGCLSICLTDLVDHFSSDSCCNALLSCCRYKSYENPVNPIDLLLHETGSANASSNFAVKDDSKRSSSSKMGMFIRPKN